MAAKKPSVKATQAKKTASRKPVAKSSKPEAARKAAPAKKAPVVRAKPPAVRPVPKPASKVSVTQPVKSVKAPAVTESAAAKPVAPPAVHAQAPERQPATKQPAQLEKHPEKPVAEKRVSEKSVAPAAAAPEIVAKPAGVAPTRAASPSAPRQAPAAKAVSSRPAAEISEAAASNDGDDDGEISLLAGPRNVKPYIARRGEQYMNKEQLEHFRNILNSWKQDLMHEVDRTVLHMKDEAANFPDPNDRATQESEFSLELRTRDRERKLIRKIEEAIKRIEDGSYGYCNETGEEIGVKRLEARPVATLCVEAQERRERREKQYGDRDDRYR
jgi:DnaK suppressor protein